MDLAATISEWFTREGRNLPWRRPGFSAWGTMVSEFMLQQTPVARVIPRLEQWLARWPTPPDLAAVPASEAIRAWESLGYPRRALALHRAATVITEQHAGTVPDDVDALLALPGVGPYTARAIAVFAYGQRHPVVDTNVRRVLARAVGAKSQPGAPAAQRDLEAMDAFLPMDRAASVLVNAGTMELGAIVCTARAPKCDVCPIAEGCAWREAGYPDLDAPTPRRQARYEGSDRQVRGLILRELRSADAPVPAEALRDLWSSREQLDRAVRTLLSDHLIITTNGDYALPD